MAASAVAWAPATLNARLGPRVPDSSSDQERYAGKVNTVVQTVQEKANQPWTGGPVEVRPPNPRRKRQRQVHRCHVVRVSV